MSAIFSFGEKQIFPDAIHWCSSRAMNRKTVADSSGLNADTASGGGRPDARYLLTTTARIGKTPYALPVFLIILSYLLSFNIRCLVGFFILFFLLSQLSIVSIYKYN